MISWAVENQLSFCRMRREIQEVICYRWNRRYPSDVKLDLPLEGWNVMEETEFAGKSHEKDYADGIQTKCARERASGAADRWAAVTKRRTKVRGSRM
ncbi:MAG: hypothetical protein ACLTSZ_09105 [Lachnospiraceae bacterium]